MELSILCITSGHPRSTPFTSELYRIGNELGAEVVVAVDGKDVHSKGYIESVLDDGLALTHGDYVLRLDDDEKVSPAMLTWLQQKQYLQAPVWSFPRVHLWESPQWFVIEQYYFPDFQTRLTTREKASRPKDIHSGCPWGWGTIARVAIEHWCYLVKSYEERCAIGLNYKQIREGADGGVYRASSIEDEHPQGLSLMEYNDGSIPIQGRCFHTEPLK